MYCSGQLIHCLKISGNKNNLRQFEAEIAKKLRTAQPQPKATGSYKKNRLVVLICNRAGFCSIRKNIRASLVEPWFVFWRDQTSPDIFQNRAKTCTITSLS